MRRACVIDAEVGLLRRELRSANLAVKACGTRAHMPQSMCVEAWLGKESAQRAAGGGDMRGVPRV